MKKDLLLLLALVLVVVLLVQGVEIKSVEEYYLEHSEDVGEGDPYVTLSITCAEALPYLPTSLRAHLPSDGLILAPTKLRLREGDSVLALLTRAARSHRIHTETSRAASSVYVEGIANLYERDAGALSGWIFRIGGEVPFLDASSVKPASGDSIEWIYTLDSTRFP